MFFEVSHVKIENLELDAAVTWSTARDYKHSNNDYDVLVESHAINIQDVLRTVRDLRPTTMRRRWRWST